jgi:hypothetical protein
MEDKMHCFKRLRERVMALTFERQVVGLYVRVALLNHFSQLGRPVTVAVASLRLELGLGPSDPSIPSRNNAPWTQTQPIQFNNLARFMLGLIVRCDCVQ